MTSVLAIDSRVSGALIVIGGLAIFGALLLAASWGDIRGHRAPRVPWGYRPAPSDDELERDVNVRWKKWSLFSIVLMALWIPAYWLREPRRMNDKRAFFQTEAVTEGRATFIAYCAACHGPDAGGGLRQYLIGGVTRNYAEPPLKYAYARYLASGRSQDEITQLIYDAIGRGRPGTPMPTWGIAFGGPLSSRQVDNVVTFLQSIQQEFPKEMSTNGADIFSRDCAVCHGENGGGGVGLNLRVSLKRLTIPELRDVIHKGRVNINRPSMPSWGVLGDPAIEALVQFIESIQEK